jgi:3-phosphoshikimate 1-carboxyvinyltransferase
MPGSEVTAHKLLLNPTRTGFIQVMQRMGAKIAIQTSKNSGLGAECIGSATAGHCASLQATTIEPEQVPTLIDEVPILALLACAARGQTRFKAVGELRVKESDRLAAIIAGLVALGFEAWEEGDDLLVEGQPTEFLATLASADKTRLLATHGDHRLAMTWAIAELISGQQLNIENRACVAVSYPGFYTDLQQLQEDAK